MMMLTSTSTSETTVMEWGTGVEYGMSVMEGLPSAPNVCKLGDEAEEEAEAENTVEKGICILFNSIGTKPKRNLFV